MARVTRKGNVKVVIEGPKVQDFIRDLGLLPRGKVQTFIDTEVVRLADPYVPSDTTAIRKSVFTNTDFGSGQLIYSIYGNPRGRNTWNDKTSRFQDAPRRGSEWIPRMLDAGGLEKLEEGVRRLVG